MLTIVRGLKILPSTIRQIDDESWVLTECYDKMTTFGKQGEDISKH